MHSAAMCYASAALAGPGVWRQLRHGRDGAGLVQRHADPEAAHPGARLRAGSGRLHRPRPGPRQACADGHFHVVGRRFAPASPGRHRKPGRCGRDLPGCSGPAGPGAAAPPWRPWRGPGPLRWRRSQPLTPAGPGRTGPGWGWGPGGRGPGGQRPGRHHHGTAAARARGREGLPGGDGRHYGLHADHHDLDRRPHNTGPPRSAALLTGWPHCATCPAPFPGCAANA